MEKNDLPNEKSNIIFPHFCTEKWIYKRFEKQDEIPQAFDKAREAEETAKVDEFLQWLNDHLGHRQKNDTSDEYIKFVYEGIAKTEEFFNSFYDVSKFITEDEFRPAAEIPGLIEYSVRKEKHMMRIFSFYMEIISKDYSTLEGLSADDFLDLIVSRRCRDERERLQRQGLEGVALESEPTYVGKLAGASAFMFHTLLMLGDLPFQDYDRLYKVTISGTAWKPPLSSLPWTFFKPGYRNEQRGVISRGCDANEEGFDFSVGKAEHEEEYGEWSKAYDWELRDDSLKGKMAYFEPKGGNKYDHTIRGGLSSEQCRTAEEHVAKRHCETIAQNEQSGEDRNVIDERNLRARIKDRADLYRGHFRNDATKRFTALIQAAWLIKCGQSIPRLEDSHIYLGYSTRQILARVRYGQEETQVRSNSEGYSPKKLQDRIQKSHDITNNKEATLSEFTKLFIKNQQLANQLLKEVQWLENYDGVQEMRLLEKVDAALLRVQELLLPEKVDDTPLHVQKLRAFHPFLAHFFDYRPYKTPTDSSAGRKAVAMALNNLCKEVIGDANLQNALLELGGKLDQKPDKRYHKIFKQFLGYIGELGEHLNLSGEVDSQFEPPYRQFLGPYREKRKEREEKERKEQEEKARKEREEKEPKEKAEKERKEQKEKERKEQEKRDTRRNDPKWQSFLSKLQEELNRTIADNKGKIEESRLEMEKPQTGLKENTYLEKSQTPVLWYMAVDSMAQGGNDLDPKKLDDLETNLNHYNQTLEPFINQISTFLQSLRKQLFFENSKVSDNYNSLREYQQDLEKLSKDINSFLKEYGGGKAKKIFTQSFEEIKNGINEPPDDDSNENGVDLRYQPSFWKKLGNIKKCIEKVTDDFSSFQKKAFEEIPVQLQQYLETVEVESPLELVRKNIDWCRKELLKSLELFDFWFSSPEKEVATDLVDELVRFFKGEKGAKNFEMEKSRKFLEEVLCPLLQMGDYIELWRKTVSSDSSDFPQFLPTYEQISRLPGDNLSELLNIYFAKGSKTDSPQSLSSDSIAQKIIDQGRVIYNDFPPEEIDHQALLNASVQQDGSTYTFKGLVEQMYLSFKSLAQFLQDFEAISSKCQPLLEIIGKNQPDLKEFLILKQREKDSQWKPLLEALISETELEKQRIADLEKMIKNLKRGSSEHKFITDANNEFINSITEWKKGGSDPQVLKDQENYLKRWKDKLPTIVEILDSSFQSLKKRSFLLNPEALKKSQALREYRKVVKKLNKDINNYFAEYSRDKAKNALIQFAQDLTPSSSAKSTTDENSTSQEGNFPLQETLAEIARGIQEVAKGLYPCQKAIKDVSAAQLRSLEKVDVKGPVEWLEARIETCLKGANEWSKKFSSNEIVSYTKDIMKEQAENKDKNGSALTPKLNTFVSRFNSYETYDIKSSINIEAPQTSKPSGKTDSPQYFDRPLHLRKIVKNLLHVFKALHFCSDQLSELKKLSRSVVNNTVKNPTIEEAMNFHLNEFLNGLYNGNEEKSRNSRKKVSPSQRNLSAVSESTSPAESEDSQASQTAQPKEITVKEIGKVLDPIKYWDKKYLGPEKIGQQLIDAACKTAKEQSQSGGSPEAFLSTTITIDGQTYEFQEMLQELAKCAQRLEKFMKG